MHIVIIVQKCQFASLSPYDLIYFCLVNLLSVLVLSYLLNHTLSNFQFLVDWTRGRNLIFSVAAPSVNEIRGPYDVTNLSYLLVLSIKQAKAATSKNCRNNLQNSKNLAVVLVQ